MSRVCYFTGRRTRTGNSIARRGKAKYLGGVGIKTTGVTKRKFKPNIQKVRAVIDGKIIDRYEAARASKLLNWSELCVTRDREKAEAVARVEQAEG